MLNSVYTGKSEGKVVPAYAMKACRWSGGIAPLILNCAIRCMEPLALATLCLGKSLRYPLNIRLVGSQSHFGEERNLFKLPEFEPQIV